MHALTAEDGGGHGPQPVAAQVQLLQLLQPCQFTAGKGGGGSHLSNSSLSTPVSDRMLDEGAALYLAVKVCSWL